jgi:hypothetical protein
MGKQSIKKELDLFYYLKKSRRIQATMLAITTPEQRRLIKQQVKAGLYVAPPVGIGQLYENFKSRTA